MATETQIRRASVDLATLAKQELASLTLPKDPYKAKDLLIQVVPLIANHYGLAAATLTADWYDDMRAAENVKGRFRAIPYELPDTNRFVKLVEYGIAPLFQEEPDFTTMLSKINGGMQRTIMNQQRLTVVNSSQVDPQSKGWSRVGNGDNCQFCEMLISRGGVYTGKSVTFRSHDHCNCTAKPSWDPNARLVSEEPFKQSTRRRSDATRKADNKRAYEFYKDL